MVLAGAPGDVECSSTIIALRAFPRPCQEDPQIQSRPRTQSQDLSRTQLGRGLGEAITCDPEALGGKGLLPLRETCPHTQWVGGGLCAGQFGKQALNIFNACIF